VLGLPFTGEEDSFSNQELDPLVIMGNHIYHHKVLRVNYTMYDGRWRQDSLNLRNHADFMTFSHETDTTDPHPFWYGRIIGIFHARVRYFQHGRYTPEYDTSNSSMCAGLVMILASIQGSDTGNTHGLGSMTQNMRLDFSIRIKSFEAHILSLDSIMPSRWLPWDHRLLASHRTKTKTGVFSM